MSAVVTTVGLLLAGLCFWQGLPALTGTGHRATASTPAQSGERELITTPIEELRPGHRVLAKNPELGGQDVPPRLIDPELDRLVSFRMAKPDGSFVEWDRIESIPELFLGVLLGDEVAFNDLPEDADDDAVCHCLIGRTVEVELSEFGVSGPATILAVAACPEIEADDGPDRRLVTAVFRHTSNDVYDVDIADEPRLIGTTGNHPFWSEDRQKFVRADELHRGERLRRASDAFTTVASVTHRTTTEPVTVYNLEVDGHHVYYVGDGGVLVHNTYAAAQPKTHIVYQATDPRTGKVYTGISSGVGSPQQILNRRFSGGHHTVLDVKNAKVVWSGSSRGAARGLEDLLYSRQKLRGNAFHQNRPVGDRNRNLRQYLQEAIDAIAAGELDF